MVPRRRAARRGRRAARRPPQSAAPSVAELAVYGMLAALVAAALLRLGGRSWVEVGAVVAATLVLIGVIAVATPRLRPPTDQRGTDHEPTRVDRPPTPTRRDREPTQARRDREPTRQAGRRRRSRGR